MSRTLIAGLTLFILLLAHVPARAEGWGMPNLNPFSSTPKKATPYKVNDGKSNSWVPSMPSMPTLPGWGTSAPRKGPTMWDKAKAAPGNIYNKTKETLSPLNPFATQPKKTSMYLKPKNDDEVSGFWPNWMTVAEKEESKAITVTDWLDGKKPGDE